MKQLLNRSVLLLSFVLLTTVLHAQTEVPVLPYPQYVMKGNGKSSTAGLSLKSAGLKADIMHRLNDAWQKGRIKASAGNATITLGILGHNKDFDAKVKSYARQWVNKPGKEGYLLILKPGRNLLAANTETGLFYGLQSLRQLQRAGWKEEVFIADWPSFPERFMYDDISRGPISTVAYVKQQIDRMAEQKINGLSFYIEHVVKTRSYPDFAPVDGKFTIQDIKELSAYARKNHMQLMGSFQSFGHFNNILSLPQYSAMGETANMISPLDPKARLFLKSVIEELIDAFDSPYFNINCDETFDLGKGKSKAYVDSVGVAKYYADHIKFLYNICKAKGKKTMMWGDIALEHEEILDMLPKDIVYGTWEYGNMASYAKFIDPFVKRNLKFLVCPGVLNTNRLVADLAIAKSNINGFTNEGYQKGASGVLTAIWDEGGDQLFSEDWYGVAAGAEKSWNVHTTLKDDFDQRYEQTVYGTNSGNYVKAIGQLMHLRNLPLTYNLTDQVWWQKILPAKGETLILNNADVPKALSYVNNAKTLLDSFKPLRNDADVATMRYLADRYKLLLETREQIAAVSEWYNAKPRNNAEATKYLSVIGALRSRYQVMMADFKAKWGQENQPYFLDYALKPYLSRIAALNDLEQLVSQTQTNATTPLVRIVANNNYQFQYWLLSGPFQSDSGFPEFLYSENKESNHPPKPGDMVSYQARQLRWSKFSSTNGGLIRQLPGAAAGSYLYAFCTITSAEAKMLEARVGSNSEVQLFVNGKQISAGDRITAGSDILPKETAFKVSLNAATNYILLKVRVGSSNGEFTFRLNTTEPIINHKHKYTINPNMNDHEAD